MADPAFTLTQLRYFAAARELGSMTAAPSKQLMVSQSRGLDGGRPAGEEAGGAAAARHHARGLTLTSAGEEFYRELRSYLVHHLSGWSRSPARRAGRSWGAQCPGASRPWARSRLRGCSPPAKPTTRASWSRWWRTGTPR